MNVPIAPVSSLTERKVPRRIAWRMMMPEKISSGSGNASLLPDW